MFCFSCFFLLLLGGSEGQKKRGSHLATRYPYQAGGLVYVQSAKQEPTDAAMEQPAQSAEHGGERHEAEGRKRGRAKESEYSCKELIQVKRKRSGKPLQGSDFPDEPTIAGAGPARRQGRPGQALETFYNLHLTGHFP